jgi:hypothetical protein
MGDQVVTLDDLLDEGFSEKFPGYRVVTRGDTVFVLSPDEPTPKDWIIEDAARLKLEDWELDYGSPESDRYDDGGLYQDIQELRKALGDVK